jgi:ABC-2 type transport system permease protein
MTPRFWSNILAIAYREAIVLRHDKAFIGVVLAQPVMMLLLFGFVLSNEPANVRWGIVDRDASSASRRLVQDVQATGYFLPPRPLPGYADARRHLRAGELLTVLVVPEHFAADLERGRARVQVLLDGSDPVSAARVGGYIGQVAAAFEAGREPRPRLAGDLRIAVPIDVRQRFWFNRTLKDRAFFMAALAGMLLTNLCLSMTSQGLVGERETGTYEQMLALPTSTLEIVLGKMLPYVGVAYVVMLFATIAPGILFGLWPRGGMVALCIATLPFILASLAIGVFVSTLARSTAQSVFITVFFIMPSFVLSGSMYPYQLMPRGVRELGSIFPLRWYQIASRRIIERGAGLADVMGPMLALLLLFALLLTLIRWRIKPRLG